VINLVLLGKLNLLVLSNAVTGIRFQVCRIQQHQLIDQLIHIVFDFRLYLEIHRIEMADRLQWKQICRLFQ
jgi:hypothetical protein